jgi:hypothetical protein
VKRAAEKDVGALLDKIPQEAISNYGFDNRAEFDEVVVETPIQVYTPVPGLFSTDSQEIADAIHPTQSWRVPLSVNGEWRALLTVVRNGERFETVNLGAAGLARTLEKQHRALPGTAIHPYLLRVYEMRRDWLGYRHKNEAEARYIPLSPTAGGQTVAFSPVRESVLIRQIRSKIKVVQ